MILTDRCHVDVRDTWQVVLYLDRSMCGALKSNLGFFNSNPIKFLLEFILLQKREIKLDKSLILNVVSIYLQVLIGFLEELFSMFFLDVAVHVSKCSK